MATPSRSLKEEGSLMELFLSADTRLPYLPPTGKRPLHRHAMRIMDVYAPEPEVPYERVVWPADASAEGGADTADAGGGGAAAAATASAVPTAETTWCEPQLAKLRSKHSRHEAFVLFVNNTPYTVRILWINYRGEERVYDVVEPRQRYIQHTFATHPWVVREVNTGHRLPINMQEAFCPHRTPPTNPPAPAQGQPAAAAAAAAAAADAPAGAPAAADAAAAGDGQQGRQQQQAQAPAAAAAQDQFFYHTGPDGRLQRIPVSTLQRAEITILPALAWSEATHTHFPRAFKQSVRSFLLCHLQLSHSLATSMPTTPTAAAAAESVFGVGGSSSGGSGGAAADGVAAHPSASSSSHSHLGHLPTMLLSKIVGFAAPYTPQHMDLPVAVRPDILPTRLYEHPDAGANNAAEFGDDEDEDDWSDEEEGSNEGSEEFDELLSDEEAVDEGGEGDGDGEGGEQAEGQGGGDGAWGLQWMGGGGQDDDDPWQVQEHLLAGGGAAGGGGGGAALAMDVDQGGGGGAAAGLGAAHAAAGQQPAHQQD